MSRCLTVPVSVAGDVGVGLCLYLLVSVEVICDFEFVCSCWLVLR